MNPYLILSLDEESVEYQSEVDSLSCNSGKPASNPSSLYSQDNEQVIWKQTKAIT